MVGDLLSPTLYQKGRSSLELDRYFLFSMAILQASSHMHKSGGSLTQSSLLLTGPDVHAGYVRQIINLTQTTSASYLLLSSLDISRRKNFDFVCFMAIVQLYRYNVWFSIIKNTFIIKSEFILNY